LLKIWDCPGDSGTVGAYGIPIISTVSLVSISVKGVSTETMEIYLDPPLTSNLLFVLLIFDRILTTDVIIGDMVQL
jgi:L-lactate permease